MVTFCVQQGFRNGALLTHLQTCPGFVSSRSIVTNNFCMRSRRVATSALMLTARVTERPLHVLDSVYSGQLADK